MTETPPDGVGPYRSYEYLARRRVEHRASPNLEALVTLRPDLEMNEEAWEAMLDGFYLGRVAEASRAEDEEIVTAARRIGGHF